MTRTDRRTQTLYSLAYGAFNPRRQHNRRPEDDQRYIPDLHCPKLALLAIAVVVMSSLDAFFTLNLLARGAEELNLAMKVLIESDTTAFVITKYSLTAAGVLCLLACARLKLLGRIPVSRILQAVFAGYACLMIYEVFLLVVSSTALQV